MKKIMSALAVILLLMYIGYQVSQNLTEQIETIDALVVDVEDKITCKGIFVRDSIAIGGDGGKAYEFLVENGEKVSKGQTIAAYFDSVEQAEAFRAGVMLEKDIESAEEAYKSIVGDDGGVTLDAVIFRDMEELSAQLALGRAWAVDSLYSSLTQSVIAREYPRDDIKGLEQAIADMKSRLSSYKNASSGGSYTLTAQASGYFVKAAESMPTLCTVEEMYSLTPQTLSRLVETENNPVEEDIVGYIIDSFEWYFVCEIDSVGVAELEQRGRATLSFPYMTSEKVEGKVEKVTYYDDSAIVIFSCGYMDADFLAGDCETADIVKRTYSGIRLPREAIHMNDGEWGVYCLSGAVVKFKAVEWVYQGDTYYIAEPAESSTKGLYLYDKIIVKGKNLQENMVIK